LIAAALHRAPRAVIGAMNFQELVGNRR
jgi:hypothetical protein